jgi:hypothetical protein
MAFSLCFVDLATLFYFFLSDEIWVTPLEFDGYLFQMLPSINAYNLQLEEGGKDGWMKIWVGEWMYGFSTPYLTMVLFGPLTTWAPCSFSKSWIVHIHWEVDYCN